MRTVVTVATPEFEDKVTRLMRELGTKEQKFVFRGCIPPKSPSHQSVPYAFKVYAIEEAVEHGFESVLWCDSSIVPIRPLEPLWQLTESQGYWFSSNHHWNTGQWTCDNALPILGISREESFTIPHVCATAFGLDFRHQIARDFFAEWKRLSEAGAFQGPWGNDNGEASPDPRVLGHRHDQTATSVVAWRLGMKLTVQPDYISDGAGENEKTILVVRRGT